MNIDQLKQKRAELDALIGKAEAAEKVAADIANALAAADALDLGLEKIVGAALYLRAHPEIVEEAVKLAAAVLPKKRGRRPAAAVS